MRQLPTQLFTDQWITATWEEYLEAIAAPIYAQASSYYDKGQLRIEMTPTGHDHSADNLLISFAVNLYGSLKQHALKGLVNCSYRQAGAQECQPDVSYYIGDHAQIIPRGTTIIDLNQYPPPDLVIEVSLTTLSDDLGQKRLMYEALGVKEYWVVNVQTAQIIAFAIVDRGSRRIDRSQVLPGLTMSLLEQALQQSQTIDQSQVGTWLMAQIQALP